MSQYIVKELRPIIVMSQLSYFGADIKLLNRYCVFLLESAVLIILNQSQLLAFVQHVFVQSCIESHHSWSWWVCTSNAPILVDLSYH